MMSRALWALPLPRASSEPAGTVNSRGHGGAAADSSAVPDSAAIGVIGLRCRSGGEIFLQGGRSGRLVFSAFA